MSLLKIIDHHHQARPEQLAILGLEKEPLTYRELWGQIQQVGVDLRNLGVDRLDRVAVVLPNGPEMAVSFLAISCFCAIAPLNPNYREPEYDFYLKDLGAKYLIVVDDIETIAAVVAQKLNIPIIKLRPDPRIVGKFLLTSSVQVVDSADGPSDQDHVALILHTSGTTSRPKMVPLTQKNILTSAKNVAASLSLDSGDVCLNIMPLFHIHGLIGVLLSSIVSGATVACSTGYLAPEFFNWLKIFKPTWYSAVPTMHQGILQWAADNTAILESVNLRFIRSSSSSLPPTVMQNLEKVFEAPVIESYGMTEAAHQMASNPLPPAIRKPGSVGPAAGPEMNIMDETGQILHTNGIGEVVIKGENVTKGYAQNPEANETAFTGGWFRTGDQGYKDEQGYYYITGRLKEIINRAGEKISPREIDEIMLAHPEVKQATAFAIPHGILGEEIGLALILTQDDALNEFQVKEYLSERLADFKVPRVVHFVHEIPKGPTGKLQRIGLAEKFGIDMSYQSEDQLQEIEFLAARTTLESDLLDVWQSVLKKEHGIADNFFALGGDSIIATNIIARYRDHLSYQMSFLSFFRYPSVREQARSLLIDKLRNASSEEYEQLAQQIQELPENEAEIILKSLS